MCSNSSSIHTRLSLVQKDPLLDGLTSSVLRQRERDADYNKLYALVGGESCRGQAGVFVK